MKIIYRVPRRYSVPDLPFSTLDVFSRGPGLCGFLQVQWAQHNPDVPPPKRLETAHRRRHTHVLDGVVVRSCAGLRYTEALENVT